ncbi:hypothetical protein FB565_002946 [Actinoplanes lutulentus]|uniref:Uncharacterized protein n=1 Tax=Actinoplanes lutulentus TaxID=1287878 RepID=A0A327Z1H2_9ACTN|nr:hypothetical protein [Actinoplanes lutulentus]MBB2943233.1 hypothetical protein [Actinoplanes lutulentus]RAK28294.1 hypothetical protein B0I29_12062 [Actinoplanes lutulentus]
MSQSVRSVVPAGFDAPRLVLGEQPFDVAATALRLLTAGPGPLSVDGAVLGGGLPRRRIVLSELASVLMHPSCGHTTSDEVWRLLIERSRTDGPAWVVGAVGVALPGLRQAAYRLRRYSGDVQAELLTGFVAALRTVNPAGSRVVQRLLSAAFTAARTELRASESHREAGYLDTTASWPKAGHPDVVLTRAVTAGVITAADAELIGATRLAGTSVADYAASTSKGAKAIYKARDRAEAQLVAALHAGLLSDQDAEVIAEATMTLRADPPHRF